MSDLHTRFVTPNATDRFITSEVLGDTDKRFELQANGKMLLGDGTNAQDLTLERLDGGVLGVNGVAASPNVVTLATSTTLTAADHANRILLLTGTGAAYTQTLPAATGTGNKYTFVVGAVNTSNHVITTTGGDLFYGYVLTNSTGDTPDLAQPWPADASDDTTITLNGTTKGGQAVGDFIECVDIATDKWFVTGMTSSSGVEANPFS